MADAVVVMTVSEFADRWGVSPNTVRRWASGGTLPDCVQHAYRHSNKLLVRHWRLVVDLRVLCKTQGIKEEQVA